MGTPYLRRFGVLPFLGGCGAFTGLCHTGGRYSGLWAVSSTSLHPRRHRVRSRIIRCVMCRLWWGRWRRSSPSVIWLRRLVVLTARPSILSSKRWVVTVRSPTFTRAGWRPSSRSCGLGVRRRRGTPDAPRCGLSPPGVVSGGPWPAIRWPGWSHAAGRWTTPGRSRWGTSRTYAPADGAFAGEDVVADAVRNSRSSVGSAGPRCGGLGPGETAGPYPLEGWQHRYGGVGGAYHPPVGPLFG